MPEIIPITELRNTNVISEICNSKREPIFITKNGYGDLVVMSIETYKDLLDVSATDSAIFESETEIRSSGHLFDAKEALDSLRRKHFG